MPESQRGSCSLRMARCWLCFIHHKAQDLVWLSKQMSPQCPSKGITNLLRFAPNNDTKGPGIRKRWASENQTSFKGRMSELMHSWESLQMHLFWGGHWESPKLACLLLNKPRKQSVLQVGETVYKGVHISCQVNCNQFWNKSSWFCRKKLILTEKDL